MKITVGHLVIAAGVGTFLVLGPLGGLRRLDKARGTAASDPGSASVVNDRAKDALPPPAAEPGPALPFQERLPAGETEPKDIKASDFDASVAPAAPAPADPIPAVEAAPEPATPAAKPVRKRRAKGKAAAAAAPADGGAENLLGTYVSLRLSNGREVKGELVEKSATFYKIELPGLGAMSYPARDVVSVVPAQ